MIVGLRQFCFLFLFFLLINIVIRVLYYSIHARTDDLPIKKQGPRSRLTSFTTEVAFINFFLIVLLLYSDSRKYKYGRTLVVNISQNMKILHDLIISTPPNVKDIDLNNEENLNIYTNISDFLFQYNFNTDIEKESLKPCPLYAPGLGPVADDQSVWSLLGIDDMYLWIQPGGIFLPTECVARQQVAIIVPVHKTMRFEYNFNSGIQEGKLAPCPTVAPNLGPLADDKKFWRLFGIDNIYLRTQPGGIHLPAKCLAVQHVAIILPIHETGRTKTLYVASFLYYIHPFLMKQQLEYQIFVILKPNATIPYRRGKLYNIGFKEAQTYRPGGWGCIIFHDPHLVPLDTRNLYRCSQHPRMLKSVLQKPYKFGGAVAIRPRHFAKANGFSNLVWSNDDDYIDMYKRLRAANLTVESNVAPIGNYTYFEALRQENNDIEKIQTNPPLYLKDGLSTVSYNIKNSMKLQQFYTLIEVED